MQLCLRTTLYISFALSIADTNVCNLKWENKMHVNYYYRTWVWTWLRKRKWATEGYNKNSWLFPKISITFPDSGTNFSVSNLTFFSLAIIDKNSGLSNLWNSNSPNIIHYWRSIPRLLRTPCPHGAFGSFRTSTEIG